MTADKVMPHSTVGQAPSGEYVVLAEGDPVPDWFTVEESDASDGKSGESASSPRRRAQK